MDFIDDPDYWSYLKVPTENFLQRLSNARVCCLSCSDFVESENANILDLLGVARDCDLLVMCLPDIPDTVAEYNLGFLENLSGGAARHGIKVIGITAQYLHPKMMFQKDIERFKLTLPEHVSGGRISRCSAHRPRHPYWAYSAVLELRDRKRARAKVPNENLDRTPLLGSPSQTRFQKMLLWNCSQIKALTFLSAQGARVEKIVEFKW